MRVRARVSPIRGEAYKRPHKHDEVLLGLHIYDAHENFKPLIGSDQVLTVFVLHDGDKSNNPDKPVWRIEGETELKGMLCDITASYQLDSSEDFVGEAEITVIAPR